MDISTISLSKVLKSRLDRLKVHPRESYESVIGRLVSHSGGNKNIEAFKETVEILSDPTIMRSLAKSIEDLKKGKTYSIDEV